MNRFYFDHNATTPVSEEVLEAMLPCFRETFGNASSIHQFGQAAKLRLETARRQLAALLGAQPQEIVLLSGGTEADNLAILGAVRHSPKPRRHVITSAIEHPAVLGPCAQLEHEGVEITRLPVSAEGRIDPDEVRRALRAETVLISVMHANNEVGTLQPLAEIGKIAREAGVLFHSDGVQAVGKVPVNVTELGLDLYSLSGHKFYGPKGVGALYVRKGTRLGPIAFGGHHERDRRPGTENVSGAVGLGRAAQWVAEHGAAEWERLAALRQRLEDGILERIPACGINASGAPRTPNTSNLWFDGIEAEAVVIALDLEGFAVSTGAACSSGATEPSHVLTAMGLPKDRGRASVRFSLGRLNDAAQVDALIDALTKVVERLRALSPVYHG